ncbi:unnamed protein product [Lepeophtheirus salmonis]|uniref:(salmon louse) hypothetical protein n=1 Tax=Lepeophtheirus salmonis TaxID=72036 RepID=A0A7R8HA17_LEPSM|nr:unnamed protein product [Lepeophtheirus salmonis]CAF2965587.1 unnamed protein product [Lepeophtheirus salmonis]
MYNRLCFDVHSAPGIFQCVTKSLLEDISGVRAFLDDIIICGKSDAEYYTRLEKVLALLEESRLKLNLSKCQFFKYSISYLGYELYLSGLNPTEEKLEAIGNVCEEWIKSIEVLENVPTTNKV